MSVPKRRPPRPHSCSWSRSPLRQCAAAKPSQVMKANSATKTKSAIQSTCATLLPFLVSFVAPDRTSLTRSHEVHDRREHRTHQHPGELEPVKEGNAPERGLDLVVERRIESDRELHEEQQIPGAAAGTRRAWRAHTRSPPQRPTEIAVREVMRDVTPHETGIGVKSLRDPRVLTAGHQP